MRTLNWFLNNKFWWPVFCIIIIVGVFFYFNVVKDPCYNENYLGAELGPECANSLIPKNLPSQSENVMLILPASVDFSVFSTKQKI